MGEVNLFNSNKKILIVSNYLYQSFLFTFKNNHPDLDIKFMMNEELIDELSFVYLKDPIPYLIKNKNIEYTKAKKYSHLLKGSNIENNAALKALYDELKGEYIPLEKDELALYELNQYDIYLFELDEDIQIKSLLNKYHLDYHLLHFNDLGFKESKMYLNPEIKIFKNKFEQYFYIFSSLRELIKSNPNIKDNISILVEDASDEFYLTYFSSLFKINHFSNLKKGLYLHPTINKKVKDILKNRSFIFNEEELNDLDLKNLYSIIKQYQLDELNDFDFAYLSLNEILKNKSYVVRTSDKGINVHTTFDFDTYSLIYVTNFQDDAFYHKAKDNNVLNDEELLNIGINPSYINSLLDKRLKHNYLRYMNINLLSRVEQHLNDKIYDSPFIDELNWNKNIKMFSFNDIKTLTTEVEPTYISHIYDSNFYHEVDELINSYDHSFKGLTDLKDIFKNRSLSVSQLKQYASCPFKYLLNILIPSIDDEKHQLWKGVLIHSVLENIYEENYDYEEAFSKGKSKYYLEMEKAQYKYGKKEEIFIEIIHTWLYPIAMMIRKEKDEIQLYFPLQKDYELPIKYQLSNQDFKGSIDKVLFTKYPKDNQPTNAERYYTIVDYKSGSHNSMNFDIRLACTGYDIQLPLYLYALRCGQNSFKDNDAKLGGFGIRHIYGSNLKDAFVIDDETSEENLKKKLKIEGVFNVNPNYYRSFDESNITDKGTFARTIKYINNAITFDAENNNKIVFKFNKKEVEYSIEEMIEDVIKIIDVNVNNILEGKFDIAPISNDIINFDKSNLTCKYCPYKDVCYHDIFDARDLMDEIVYPKFASRMKGE